MAYHDEDILSFSEANFSLDNPTGVSGGLPLSDSSFCPAGSINHHCDFEQCPWSLGFRGCCSSGCLVPSLKLLKAGGQWPTGAHSLEEVLRVWVVDWLVGMKCVLIGWSVRGACLGLWVGWSACEMHDCR